MTSKLLREKRWQRVSYGDHGRREDRTCGDAAAVRRESNEVGVIKMKTYYENFGEGLAGVLQVLKECLRLHI